MGFLRVILAISVVINHSGDFFGLKLVGGIVAVQLFFIISGFYMSLILTEKYIGPNSYKLFISNRFLKIFPIYWAILILTLLISLLSTVLVDNYGKLYPYFKYANVMPIEGLIVQILTNIVIFGQDIVMFMGIDMDSRSLFLTTNFRWSDPQFWKFLMVPQAWTLSLELTFYLIAPFLVNWSNKKLLLLLVASLFIRVFTYYLLNLSHDPWTYRFFPFEIALFLMGFLSYRLYKKLDSVKFWEFNYGGVLSIAFIFLVVFFNMLPINKWVLYLSFCCFFLPLIFSKTKQIRLDGKIGELSYSIYICHMLIWYVISPYVKTGDLSHYKGEILVITSVLFAFILVKYISEPLEIYRRKRLTAYRARKHED